MGKIKYFFALLLSLIIVGGVYIFALTRFFYPIMAIYQVISIISICGYIVLFLHHNNEIGKAKMNGLQVPENLVDKRRKRLKIYIVIFLPFTITVLCDYTYVLLLANSPLFQGIINLLG